MRCSSSTVPVSYLKCFSAWKALGLVRQAGGQGTVPQDISWEATNQSEYSLLPCLYFTCRSLYAFLAAQITLFGILVRVYSVFTHGDVVQ